MSHPQQISRAGSQTPTDGPSEYFTGRVRIEPLSPADGDINASTAYVSFEPGARSAWHTHPRGQRLRDERIVEVVAFFDSVEFNDFWRRVKP